RFSSTCSGADSWTSSTPATASSTESTSRSSPSGGSGASVSCPRAARASSRTSSARAPAPGAGSKSRTSQPLSTKRPAQPAPITPPPGSATECGLRLADTDPQRELLPHLLGTEHAHVDPLEDLDRPGDELGVRREVPAREVQVVLEPDAHVRADQRRESDERELHPADREGGVDGVRGQLVDHGEER